MLTLALLACAGAMLETSLALRAAWTDDVARAAQQRRWDIELALQAPAARGTRDRTPARAAARVQAVRAMERHAARRPRAAGGVEVVHTYPDGGHGGFALRGAPPATTLIAPHVVEGRWLAADDADGVVLNTARPRARVPRRARRRHDRAVDRTTVPSRCASSASSTRR